MLKKQRQKKYFDQVWKRMASRLDKFSESNNAAELHCLRVETKRINAHILFFKGSSKTNKLAKHSKPVNAIFKHAGLIRKAHVNLQLVEKYHLTNTAFKKEQKKIFLTQSKLFCAKRDAYAQIIEHAHKKVARDFADVRNKLILNTYEKELKKLARFFAKPENAAPRLHIYRKKLKLLLYTHKVLPKSATDKLRLNISYLNKLQETIGKWHDDKSAVELLKSNSFRDELVIRTLDKLQQELLYLINDLSRNFAEKAMLPAAKPKAKTVKPI